MKILNSISDMQAFSKEQKRAGKVVGIVPTMGYLHDGHLSLVDTAHKHADVVVVTIFVNPIQFGPNEDLDKYPRDFEHDCQLCEEHKVDAVFAPGVDDMYFDNRSTTVNEDKLSAGLCGARRPGHFQGVTTVVTKLFNAVLPDIAVFGQKDAQQALVLKRMVRDLNFPIEMIIAPIVRESDGLALSSRNKYLSAEERSNALAISRSLFKVKSDIESGELKDYPQAAQFITESVSDAGGKVDYVEVLDSETLCAPDEHSSELLIAVAAYFGSTRLIDNVLVTSGSSK